MKSINVHWSIKMPSKDEIKMQVKSFRSSNFEVIIKQENKSVTADWKLVVNIGKGELMKKVA